MIWLTSQFGIDWPIPDKSKEVTVIESEYMEMKFFKGMFIDFFSFFWMQMDTKLQFNTKLFAYSRGNFSILFLFRHHKF